MGAPGAYVSQTLTRSPSCQVGGLSHTSCLKLSTFGREACNAAAASSEACSWPRVGRHAQAVHFKGRLKPWHHHPSHCRPLRDGDLAARLPVEEGTHVNVSVRDNLRWDETSGRCVTVAGLPVRWATGKAVPKVCCFADTLLQAEWFKLLAGYVADLSGVTTSLERKRPEPSRPTSRPDGA